MNFAERFWAKVTRGEPGECWPWIGGLSHGKPAMQIENTTVSPRKIAWELTHGIRPPKERHVEVTCGNGLCMNPAHLLYQTIEERFWARVQKGDGCWIWTGRRSTRREYGQFEYRDTTRKVSIPAHRYSWELHNGPIVGHVPGDESQEVCVCHHCDNPPCVNPEHLFLGTDADNTRDKVAKGRQAKGPALAEAIRRARENMKAACEKAMGVSDGDQ